MSRVSAGRRQKVKRLIVVDGETEKIYLNIIKQKIRGASIDIKKINQCGAEAITEGLTSGNAYGIARNIQYEHFYISIDKDDLTVEQFNKICDDERNNNNVTLIFTNEAFEVWLLAHIQLMNSSIISRTRLNHMLGAFLNEEYDKTNSKQIMKIIECANDCINIPKQNTSRINTISFSAQCTNFGVLLDLLQI